MILSGQSIRLRNMITPFAERSHCNGMTYGLGPAGYDVRIAQDVHLYPGEFKLSVIIEHIEMPHDLVGRVHDKSTWARLGLALQNTIIEPGWHGFLTIELTNHSPIPIDIKSGMPIAQIIFEVVDQPVERPYDGKYQRQGEDPQPAIFEH